MWGFVCVLLNFYWCLRVNEVFWEGNGYRIGLLNWCWMYFSIGYRNFSFVKEIF